MKREIDLKIERKFKTSKVQTSDMSEIQSKFYWGNNLSITNHKNVTSDSTLNNIQYLSFISILSAFWRNDNIRMILTKIGNVILKIPLKYVFWQISDIAEVRK